jgi:CheY-specific phosphatase CheX
MGRVSRIIRAVRADGLPQPTELTSIRRSTEANTLFVPLKPQVNVGRRPACFGKVSETEPGDPGPPTVATALDERSVTELVRKSVQDMLGSIAGGKLVRRTQNQVPSCSVGLVGTIYFVGDLTWSLNLIFPRLTAGCLIRKFSGLDVDYDSPEMEDAVGELTNVVGGAVGASFHDQDINVQMSLPMVVRCPDLKTLMPVDLNLTVVGYLSTKGNLWLKTRVAENCHRQVRMPGT